MLYEKSPKNIERERRRGFRATFFCLFLGRLSRNIYFRDDFLDGRGPKLVSKVSDSYDAVQQRSKKHHARAPPRAKSDDPLSKNNDFGTRSPFPRKWWQQLRRRPPLTHASGARMTVVTQTPSNNII